MMTKWHVLDAALTAVLFIAVCVGVDLRIVVGVWLALEIVSHLAKAVIAFMLTSGRSPGMSPSEINDSARAMKARVAYARRDRGPERVA